MSLDLKNYEPALMTTSTELSLAGVYIPVYEYANVTQLSSSSSSFTMYVADNFTGSYQVAAVAVVFGTASSSGTLQIEVATGTQAVAGGTNQLTGTVSLAGTANTTVNGTLIAAPTTLTAGSRINVIFGGTLTSLANCSVTVVLAKVA